MAPVVSPMPQPLGHNVGFFGTNDKFRILLQFALSTPEFHSSATTLLTIVANKFTYSHIIVQVCVGHRTLGDGRNASHATHSNGSVSTHHVVDVTLPSLYSTSAAGLVRLISQVYSVILLDPKLLPYPQWTLHRLRHSALRCLLTDNNDPLYLLSYSRTRMFHPCS